MLIERVHIYSQPCYISNTCYVVDIVHRFFNRSASFRWFTSEVRKGIGVLNINIQYIPFKDNVFKTIQNVQF